MWAFLKRYWVVAPTVATIAALYLAADAADAVWVFWIALVVSVVFAAAPQAGRGLLEAAVRVRNYPILLRTVGQVQADKELLERKVEELTSTVGSRYTDGVEEGRDQVIGAMLSDLTSPPRLTAVTMDNEELRLVAEGDGIDVGARFTVLVRGTGDVRGHVQVVGVVPDKRAVLLRCVERTTAEFWERLEAEALSNADPPTGVVLGPYRLFDVPDDFAPGTRPGD